VSVVDEMCSVIFATEKSEMFAKLTWVLSGARPAIRPPLSGRVQATQNSAQLQFCSAFRFTAGAAGFLNVIQCDQRRREAR
jgi:hypothetical protein